MNINFCSQLRFIILKKILMHAMYIVVCLCDDFFLLLSEMLKISSCSNLLIKSIYKLIRKVDAGFIWKM